MSCNHDCANCTSKNSEGCFLIEPHKNSTIKKRIGIVSGKGGVGKSLVTSLLACAMQKEGYNSAILDGDITGPSIGKMFGITQKAYGDDTAIYPAVTSTNIQVISTNMLLESDEVPVIWRGPVIAGMVKQFYTDVVYQDVDYLFIDMPPVTGDVPLTIFQSIPLDGIIIITSPQDLVGMIVTKAVNMAKEMNIPVLGLIENYSYVKCDQCDHKMYIFGEGKTDELAAKLDLKVLAKLPIKTEITKLCDMGKVELASMDELNDVVKVLKDLY